MHEGVSVWHLKAGDEAALRQALASPPAAERGALAQAGVRSVQIFQRGRTIVTVWTAEDRAEGTQAPTFAYATESTTAAVRSLLQEPDEEHGACVLIHSWQAPDTPGT